MSSDLVPDQGAGRTCDARHCTCAGGDDDAAAEPPGGAQPRGDDDPATPFDVQMRRALRGESALLDALGRDWAKRRGESRTEQYRLLWAAGVLGREATGPSGPCAPRSDPRGPPTAAPPAGSFTSALARLATGVERAPSTRNLMVAASPAGAGHGLEPAALRGDSPAARGTAGTAGSSRVIDGPVTATRCNYSDANGDVHTGFDFEVPVGYAPPDDTKYAFLKDALPQYFDGTSYLGQSAYSWGAAEDIVTCDDDVAGTFYSNRTRSVLVEALEALWYFSHLIPNDGTSCPDAGRAVQSLMESFRYAVYCRHVGSCDVGSEATFKLRYGDGATCASLGLGCAQGGGGVPCTVQILGIGTLANSVTVINDVRVCPSFLRTMSATADGWFSLGHTLYSLVEDGTVSQVGYTGQYVAMAQTAGRLGLAAVLRVAEQLLHELLHLCFWGSHCERNCCMSSLALHWLCKMASVNGLYDSNIWAIDFYRRGWPFFSTGGCGDNRLFAGACSMLEPGRAEGDPTQFWRSRFDAENPGNFTRSRANPDVTRPWRRDSCA